MIKAYVGRLGSGKTLKMVSEAVRDFRSSKRQVYTVMRSLRFPGASWFNIEDIESLCELESGIVLLDEAQIGLNARAWQKTSERTLSALAQLRKNGLDLYLTVQHLDRLDAVLRVLVNEAVQCKIVAGFHVAVTYDPNLRDSSDRKVRQSLSVTKIDKRLYSLYNSWEVMGALRSGHIPVAEWLGDHRPAVAQQAAGDPTYFLPEWHRKVSGRCLGGIEEAERIFEELVRWGHCDSSDDWGAVVVKEATRRRWLRYFDLDHERVPMSVSFESPWAEGAEPQMYDKEVDLMTLRGRKR